MAHQKKIYMSEEYETIPATRFFFSFLDKEGTLHRIATKWMKLSGDDRSNLMKTLHSWRGEPAPVGFDTADMEKQPAMIQVIHREGRDNPDITFANINTISALPDMVNVPDVLTAKLTDPAPPTTPVPGQNPVGPTEQDSAPPVTSQNDIPF